MESYGGLCIVSIQRLMGVVSGPFTHPMKTEESEYVVPPYTQCYHADEFQWHWEELLDFHALETFLGIKIKHISSILYANVPATILHMSFHIFTNINYCHTWYKFSWEEQNEKESYNQH